LPDEFADLTYGSELIQIQIIQGNVDGEFLLQTRNQLHESQRIDRAVINQIGVRRRGLYLKMLDKDVGDPIL
jgi:hypothetical protein